MKTIVTALAVLLGVGQVAAAQPLVSPDWVTAHLETPSLVVLDIRGHTEYAKGHVPGAIDADYDKAGWRVVQADGAKGALPPVEAISATIAGLGVGDGAHVVILSEDFGAAARVYWTFKVLGHEGVSILDGGWRGWSGDVSKDSVTPVPAVFTAHYNADLRADLPEVARSVATGNRTLLDARPPAQWSGAVKTSTVARFGHLPNASWIDQSEALQPDGRLKPVSVLARIFGGLGDKPVTAYCNTGHLAATDWFVLSEILHRPDTRLYDGSLSEWAADPARPIVADVAPNAIPAK